MFRILAGSLKGRSLLLPPPEKTRPTPSRVREALFDSLTSRLYRSGGVWADLTVLDAFAGSGALGLEALSRGASRAYFFEKDLEIFKILQFNIEKLGVSESADCFLTDCFSPRGAPEAVDLIFLDAPYDQGLEPLALSALEKQGWIKEETYLSIETASKHPPSDFEKFTLESSRVYGKTRSSGYRFCF